MASSQRRRAQETVRERGDSKCPYHQDQNVVYKCHDCNELACIKCTTSMHRRHELDEISDIIPETKRKIKDYVTSTEQKEIPRIKAAIKKGEDDRSVNRHYYKTFARDIEKQRGILKFKLDEAANGLLKACHDMEQGSEDVFDKHETDLQAMIEELNAQIKDFKNALHSENDVLVCDISTFILSKYKAIPSISSYRLCTTASQLDEQWTKALETLKTLGVEFMANQERHLTLDHQSKKLGSKWLESSEEKLYRLRLDYTKLDTESRQLRQCAAEYERQLGLAKFTVCQYKKQVEEVSKEYVRLKEEKTNWNKKYTKEIDKPKTENEHLKKQANKETDSKERLNKEKDKQIKKQNDDIARLKHESEQMKRIYKSRYAEKDNEVANLKSDYGTLYHAYSAHQQVIHREQQQNEQLEQLLKVNQNQCRLQVDNYQAKIAEQKGKLTAAEKEKEKLLTRLSKIPGATLTQGNAVITDLSDQNRPMKLAEKYSELYDNEWTDALEELLDHGDGISDDQGIAILLEIVLGAYSFCCKMAEEYSQGILLSVTCLPTCQTLSDSQQVQLTDEHKQMLEDIRKTLSPHLVQSVEEKYIVCLRDILLKYFGKKTLVPVRGTVKPQETHANVQHAESSCGPLHQEDANKQRTKEDEDVVDNDHLRLEEAYMREQQQTRNNIGQSTGEGIPDEHNISFEKIIDFGKKCANVCWMMRVRAPPIHMEYDVQLGSELNTDVFKHYTQSGKIVKFLVWPALFLHKNGTLLTKGVVQPMKKKGDEIQK